MGFRYLIVSFTSEEVWCLQGSYLPSTEILEKDFLFSKDQSLTKLWHSFRYLVG